MAFKKRSSPVTTVGAGADFNISLGASFGRVWGFTAKATGDVLARIRLKDADNRIIFLDAADRDYVTAKLDFSILNDDTATGLTSLVKDGTGAAAAAGEAAPPPIVRSPITVTWSNGTAGDTLVVELYVEV
jgi:hypothetical protein